MEVTKDTIIGDIIDCDEAAGEFFLEIGMHCRTALYPAAKRLKRPAMYTASTRTHW